MEIKTPKVLILGSSGMLGRVVFKYLKNKYPNIYGTMRSKAKISNTIYFDANYKKTDIFKQGNYDYVINCIGLLRNSGNRKEAEYINSKFPKLLEKSLVEIDCKLIHISTNAVFSNNSGIVFENNKTNPEDTYGKTKLRGEISEGLNIRTSILGFDPHEHKGLLEAYLNNKSEKIEGFAEELWSGCTTLQLSKFIENLIYKDQFRLFTKKTNIIHFAPLGPISKFEILKNFSKIIYNGKIVKNNTKKVTRDMRSLFENEIDYGTYGIDIKNCLMELIKFEKVYLIKYEK